VGIRERQHRGPVEPPGRAQVDVLEDRVAAEPRGLEVPGEPPVLAVLHLPVDQQPEPLLERERCVVGMTLLVGERPRHAAEGQGVEPVDRGRDEHPFLLHS
jgi:hypothetical protein